jgi:hypothetical protein
MLNYSIYDILNQFDPGYQAVIRKANPTDPQYGGFSVTPGTWKGVLKSDPPTQAEIDQAEADLITAGASPEADWDGFMREMAWCPLIVWIITNKGSNVDLSIALLDIMVLINFEKTRHSACLAFFWQNLLTQYYASGLLAPPENILEWNDRVTYYQLPTVLLIPVD